MGIKPQRLFEQTHPSHPHHTPTPEVDIKFRDAGGVPSQHARPQECLAIYFKSQRRSLHPPLPCRGKTTRLIRKKYLLSLAACLYWVKIKRGNVRYIRYILTWSWSKYPSTLTHFPADPICFILETTETLFSSSVFYSLAWSLWSSSTCIEKIVILFKVRFL